MSKEGDKDGKGDGEEEDEDPRLEVMCNYVLLALRLKPDKWQKMILLKESAEIVMNFLDTPDINLMLIVLTAAGVLQPMLTFPPTAKPKAVYFYRKQAEAITKDNFKTVLGFGDLSCKPVDELGILINEMFIPLFSNPLNQHGWPGTVAADLMNHAHKLKDVIYEVQGKMVGKSLLPLPVAVNRLDSVIQDIVDSEGQKMDLLAKADIEGIVGRWAEAINRVLAENSSCAFDRETHPTPRFEVDFWELRYQNLLNIYDQFHNPRVKNMATVLKLTGSANFYSFRSTFENVVIEMVKARDICAYLKPLVKQLDRIEANDFKDLGPLLRPFIQCIALLWCHCRNYCNTERIVTLLREVSNLMIEQCSKYLDPSAVFQGDPDETLMHVTSCLELFDEFRDVFESYREELVNFFPEDCEPVPWTFHIRAVFQRIFVFVERLKDIKHILSTTVEYLKLEKVEIGGTRGRMLSGRVVKVFENFQKVFAAFNAITYDCLDPEEAGFKKTYDTYFKHIEDMDCTLAAVFGQAMDDCTTLESIYKLLYIGTTLLERPIIKQVVLPKYSYIIPMMAEELTTCKTENDLSISQEVIGTNLNKYIRTVSGQVLHSCTRCEESLANISVLEESKLLAKFIQIPQDRSAPVSFIMLAALHDLKLNLHCPEMKGLLLIYDDQIAYYKENGKMIVDKNFPPVSGALMWIHELRERLRSPFEHVRELEIDLVSSPDFLYQMGKYEEMMEILQELWDIIFKQWADEVPDICERNLTKTLINQAEDNMVLSLNFDPELVELLHEMHYMTVMEITGIPDDAVNLYNRNETLVLWIQNLNRIIEWYNTIRLRTKRVEFHLAEDEINIIDELLKNIIENLNWNTEDNWDYIYEVRQLVESLYNRVTETQKNVQEITKMINTWREDPLFQRKDGNKDELFDWENKGHRVHDRYAKLKEIGAKIADLVFENFKKFFNIVPPEELEDLSEEEEEEEEFGLEEEEEEEEVGGGPEELVLLDDDDEDDKTVPEAQKPKVVAEAKPAEEVKETEAAAAEEEGEGEVEGEGEGEGEGEDVESGYEEDEMELPLEGEYPSESEEEEGETEEGESTVPPEGTEETEEGEEAEGTEEMATTETAEEEGEDEYEEEEGEGEDEDEEGVDETIEQMETVQDVEEADEAMAKVSEILEKKEGEVPAEGAAPAAAAEEPEVEITLEEEYGLNEIQTANWHAYLEYIDDIVANGLARAIEVSLQYFLDEMDPDSKPAPFFEASLELYESDIGYNPSMDIMNFRCFYRNVDGLMFDIYRMSYFVPRVAKHLQLPNYKKDMERLERLKDKKSDILRKVRAMHGKANEYTQEYDKYSYLWLENRQLFLSQFLKYGHTLTPEETEIMIAAQENEELPGLKETPPTLAQFKEQIDHYQEVYDDVNQIEEERIFDMWFRVNVKPFKQALLNTVCKWMNLFKQHLVDHVINSLNDLEDFIKEADEGLQKPVPEGDYDALLYVMEYLFRVQEHMDYADTMFEPLQDIIEMLKQYGVTFPEEVLNQMQELPDKWEGTKKIAVTVKQAISPLVSKQTDLINKQVAYFNLRQNQYRTKFLKSPLFRYDCENAYEEIDKTSDEIAALEKERNTFLDQSQVFQSSEPEFQSLVQCRKELKMLKSVWDFRYVVESNVEAWKKTAWKKLDVEGMEMECKKMGRELRGLDKSMRKWDVYKNLEASIKNLLTSLRAVTELQNPSIKPRHWQQLMDAIKIQFTIDDKTTLADLLALRLHEYEEEVKFVVEKSVKEMAMEKVLKEVNAYWTVAEFDLDTHPRTGLKILRPNEEMVEILEDNQGALQNMMSSKYVGFFLKEVSDWQQKLSNADQVLDVWFEVQRTWSHLESIFIGSEDIRKQLPEDTARFASIDSSFKALLKDMVQTLNVVKATNKPGVFEKLEELQSELTVCEKALSEYLETKRLGFPRFYFISSADLLDILSNGNQPELVAKHLCKLYDSMAKLKFKPGTKSATAMWAKDGEYVPFKGDCDCSGAVEMWLNKLTEAMRTTMRKNIEEAVNAYVEHPRDKWIFMFAAQVVLVGTQIWWSTEVNLAFARLEEGYENAIKDYNRKQISQLNALINLLLGDLTAEERQKIMTVCTIDVHSRDVVAKLIVQRIDSSTAFQWQSQLRHRWDEKFSDCFGNICDAQFQYAHEYLGCTPRLVITPLTDRCYITLTQSLRLIMGGAPAGPAGTGKTETTKDLGRALGVMVYVFNCSEQMDYKSCEAIYKGLAQTGAWGCFDEFNRISVEVLSVVAVQVKCVLDAIKSRKSKFNYFGYLIVLKPTVGLFITMNPGYAGRTELPENLKALFRPCAMVVPDFELICEIMLVAEGFQLARLLAHKFITLYSLCKELLSKQDHYDWGLRAIKSVLVVAGSLRRADRERPEDQVLMRALRDFNVPKIVTDDMSVFMGLIGDLFPALNVPRKRNLDFEKMIKQATIDINMQPEDSFILKVVQLQELLDVRHSVFIVGNAGTGKTVVWKTLYKTYQNQKRKPYYNDLNPKAVTNNELFGFINPSTREWKDGLIPILFRDQANMSGDGPKWIVLDGDIDATWVESMNTVMDDNKVLTLASNERIALTKMMRLLFEIYTLRVATPATVSRAGILYVNPADLGWNPYVLSWIETRPAEAEKAILTVLFDKYVPSCLEVLRTKVKKITPIPEIAHLQMLCYLLDSLLIPANVPEECPKEWYEIYFVFSAVWAFGSTLYQDQIVDHRVEFTKWWVSEFKTVKFPSGNTVFSYYIDPETKKFVPWSNMVRSFELDYDIPLQATLVPTSETTCIRYLMDLLIAKMIPVMLVGTSGTGKSVIVQEKLNSLPDNYAVTNVPFNFYTTSAMLQRVLEKPLEKKAGRNYGPKGNKTMIYFVDDMNMPEVDIYYTVQPHCLLRQFLDYAHWYDRTKMQLRDIHNCQFVSCMNPTAGSFTINPRLQRHFCVFAVNFPTGESSFHIYHELLHQHLKNPLLKMNPAVVKVSTHLANAALDLHTKVTQQFLPTAVKFHYIFNLRDLSNIFQAMLYSTAECVPNPTSLVRLWMHEAHRVYGDKLVDKSDIDGFEKLIVEIVKKAGFEDLDEEALMHKPLIYCHFAEGIGEEKYMPIKDWPHIQKLLVEAQLQYNDLVAAMNLVMFEDAIYHVCRINRIIEGPRGNALLVGVGGSGKQSLSRLSAFISSLEVFQIQLRKGYGVVDLRTDLAGLYVKAGMKSIGIMYLMADSQVGDERFLVLVNDMLASGEVPDMFADDDLENMMNNLKNEVKSTGVEDTKENCWRFFINRVRRQLKIVLCFSPVGSTLRVRARKFPSIISCTAIDWFHEWPQEALVSVSSNFLEEIEDLPAEYRHSAANFMAFVHTSVNEMSRIYLLNERRYNYTTPKTFLEQINLYGKLLKEKTEDLKHRIFRLENGLEKLKTTAAQVDDLKVTLKDQEKEVNEKNAAADQLIKVIGVETEKVSKQKAVAAEEERKVRVIEEDVTIKQKVCEEDLRKAEPALIAAQEALDTLNKNNLTELKSFGSPPDAVVNVTAAVLVLFVGHSGKLPKDRSWKECKIMMGKVDDFLNNLINYDKEHIPPIVVKEIKQYIADPQFNPEFIMAKSKAAAGLCAWVINIMKFYDVYLVVEPKRKALEQANAELQAAQDRLKALNEKVGSLEKQLSDLTAEFQKATDAKLKCQEDADRTAFTIDLANRLVGGLASESVRWIGLIKDYNQQLVTLPGDILMVTAFVSYVGCFTLSYRRDLLNKKWMPFFEQLDPPIPMQPDLNPMDMLTHDAQIAQWQNEGLPSDRMSAENATILIHSERWPLMIDPQLQGLKWIKNKYGSDLKVIRLTHRNYLDVIEYSISEGLTVLLENIMETVDAVLDPLLSRNLIKKGRVIKIGDKEVDYDRNFRLIIQTKLANPHFKPEMQAQTTLINFTVTQSGLEEQLLAEVVKAETPALDKQRSDLTKQQNDFKITLKVLEDGLLNRLAAAGENILSDIDLVLNLEKTKNTADEIEVKVAEAKVTSVKITEACEIYRPAARRSSLLYFILSDLYKINPLYQFSLKSFAVVFNNAIARAKASDKVTERVENLIDSITFMVFMYTSRGLFERDKLIFMAQMTLQVLKTAGEIEPVELDFLLRFPFVPNLTSPVDFLSNKSWGGIKALTQMVQFQGLDKDIEGAKKRWKMFVESEYPEKEKFPQEWKNKTALQKLCMMRAIRPDRMTYAIKGFVEENFGKKYTEARTIEFAKSYEEMSPITPIFFVLSPGVDPLKDVEKLGKKLGFTTDRRNLHNVSLGQGQEIVAENAMIVSSKLGHWVILQNIHLVASWLPSLEKRMEKCAEHPHKNYRLFMSAEPAPTREAHIIPQGILESSIKITNEPPTGMLANLHSALDNFNQETLEMCSKEAEFKAILFVLCYFHAAVAERRKFGPQGWNKRYPFNVGDLTISVSVLYNYLEACSNVPWEDLRYLFGEIMYGGHITDDWDRRLCRTYLEEWMKDELLDGDVYLAPGFLAPPNLDYAGYHLYIDAELPDETPYLYGLHPNAEIGFLTTSSETLFRTVFEMQPRDTGAGAGVGVSREDKVKAALEDILDRVPEPFNIHGLMAKVENKTPYVIVALQECERMNILMNEIRRSLKELELGLKGELTITADMEALEGCLFMDEVPAEWTKRAYPSLLTLGPWFADLMKRQNELEKWASDFVLPATVWLAGFFNPQSFLTAIMQQTARKNEWPLDKMCLHCDVTRKKREDLVAAPREGAYIHGLFMEGARWDEDSGCISEAHLKELYPVMPVLYIKAITQDKQETKHMYECPVYKTRIRGPTYVWTFNLRTKERAAKWTLAGVAILLSI